jgi:hypothetical protein
MNHLIILKLVLNINIFKFKRVRVAGEYYISSSKSLLDVQKHKEINCLNPIFRSKP